MSAYTGWTPASRPGIVPLHPLTFGTILGRSFTALRQNPKVLLGFALVVQTVAYLFTILAVGATAWWAFSRLDTVPYGSDEWNTLAAGSSLIVVIVGLVIGIPAAGVVVIVQGVVVAEVAAEVVAEKLSLGQVWQRVKPAAWRLIGWAALVSVVVGVTMIVVVGVLFALGLVVPPLAVLLGFGVVLAAIPVSVWLYTKLLLVPSALILERASIRDAVGRSWRLTRGRFWVAFGVVVVVSIIFSVISQTVSVPLFFGSSFLTAIVTPTGDLDVAAIVTLIVTTLGGQALVLLVQSVGTIVQSTATALVYVDCRMRHEGLDLDLQAYVERRDAGATDLPDPFLQHIGREVAPRGNAGYGGAGYAGGYAAGGYGAAGYAGYAGYAAAGYPPYPGAMPAVYPPSGVAAPAGYPPYAQPGQPPYAPPGQPPYAPTGSPAPGQTARGPGPAPTVPASPAQAPAPPPPGTIPPRPAAPASTTWTAPGTGDDGARESPWR